MARGVLVGSGGGVKVGAGGGVRATDVAAACPDCDCGGDETGPFPWPTDTGKWLVGTPCSTSVGSDKPVITRASNIASSPAFSGGTLPYPCSVGSFFNNTAGETGCAIFRYNGSVLTLTDAEAGSSAYYQTTGISWGYAPNDCCSCSQTVGGPCVEGGYSNDPFQWPNNLPAGITKVFSMPKVKNWSPGSPCQYRCCCAKATEENPVSVSLTYSGESHLRDPATGYESDTTVSITLSGSITSEFGGVAGTKTTITRVYDPLADPPERTSTVEEEVSIGFPACSSPLSYFAVNGAVGIYINNSGTVTVGCDSSSIVNSYDYTDGSGVHFYGSANGNETRTYAVACSGECNNNQGCVSGAAMFAMIGDMLYDP